MTPAPDGAIEISMTLRQQQDYHSEPHVILGILIHECIHASGIRGHYRDFQKAGREMGLVGRRARGYCLDVQPSAVPPHIRKIVNKLPPLSLIHI